MSGGSPLSSSWMNKLLILLLKLNSDTLQDSDCIFELILSVPVFSSLPRVRLEGNQPANWVWRKKKKVYFIICFLGFRQRPCCRPETPWNMLVLKGWLHTHSAQSIFQPIIRDLDLEPVFLLAVSATNQLSRTWMSRRTRRLQEALTIPAEQPVWCKPHWKVKFDCSVSAGWISVRCLCVCVCVREILRCPDLHAGSHAALTCLQNAESQRSVTLLIHLKGINAPGRGACMELCTWHSAPLDVAREHRCVSHTSSPPFPSCSQV